MDQAALEKAMKQSQEQLKKSCFDLLQQQMNAEVKKVEDEAQHICKTLTLLEENFLSNLHTDLKTMTLAELSAQFKGDFCLAYEHFVSAQSNSGKDEKNSKMKIDYDHILSAWKGKKTAPSASGSKIHHSNLKRNREEFKAGVVKILPSNVERKYQQTGSGEETIVPNSTTNTNGFQSPGLSRAWMP